jgi:ABC-type Na+ efflux pump permease subunit
LAEVVRLSGSESARAASGYFVCAYLGYGLPVILIGFFSDRIGIVNTLFGFGVILLVCNVFLGMYYQRVKKRSSVTVPELIYLVRDYLTLEH